jgi:hypothetical protein
MRNENIMVKMNTHSVCRSGIREAPIIVKKKVARQKNNGAFPPFLWGWALFCFGDRFGAKGKNGGRKNLIIQDNWTHL